MLAGYGFGAIMAVPAHDKRDYEFAEMFDLPIRDVVYPRTMLAMAYFAKHANEEEKTTDRWKSCSRGLPRAGDDVEFAARGLQSRCSKHRAH